MLLLCAIVASGCQKAGTIPDQKAFEDINKGAVQWPNTPAANLVRRAVSVAEKLNGIESQVSIRIEDKQQDVSMRVSAQLKAFREDRLRIAATKVVGDVMDLSMVGENLDVWLPTKKTLYRGQVRDLSGAGMNFHPQEIVDQLLFPVRRFAKADWKTIRREQDAMVVESTVPIDENAGRRTRLTIGTTQGELRKQEILDKSGNVWLAISYSDHKTIEGHPGLYPHRIEMTFPGEDRYLLLVIKELLPNPQAGPSDFWLIVPTGEDVVVKPLKKHEAS